MLQFRPAVGEHNRALGGLVGANLTAGTAGWCLTTSTFWPIRRAGTACLVVGHLDVRPCRELIWEARDCSTGSAGL